MNDLYAGRSSTKPPLPWTNRRSHQEELTSASSPSLAWSSLTYSSLISAFFRPPRSDTSAAPSSKACFH